MAGKNTMRLDRLLTMLGEGTRAQVKDLVRAGRVMVDGMPVRDSGMQVDAEHARVCIGNRVHEYKAVRHVSTSETHVQCVFFQTYRKYTVIFLSVHQLFCF